MKRLLIIIFAIQLFCVEQAAAQSWLDALKGAASNVIDKATGGKLTAAAIYGTWNYTQPGLKLSASSSALSDVTAAAMSSSIQAKMLPYYEKVGIRAGACKFTFNQDGTFSSTFGQRTSSGTFTFDAQSNQIVLKYESGLLRLGPITAYAYLNGTNLQLLFPMDNLLKILTSLGSASGSLASITTLLKSYDSIKIGFEFSK